MRVLVTGGAGYVGSHVVVELVRAGHDAVIADNFSNSHASMLDRLAALTGREIEHYEVDLSSQHDTKQMFVDGGFDAVIHCAGLKSVGESFAQPAAYYRNNIVTTLSVVAAMQSTGVKRLVFSSSATVYGSGAQDSPLTEEYWPLESTNPYGQTKVMIERILVDVAKASTGWKVALLRYFNPTGADESGLIGESPLGVPNNLMPLIVEVASGKRAALTVFGNDYPTDDGSGERDYVHVSDLARGHVAALDHLARMTHPARAFNLGTGCATSVFELVRAFERASGQRVPMVVGARRDGDLAVAYADPTRARTELGWVAERSVDQMCSDVWRWHLLERSGLAAETKGAACLD